MTNILYDHLQVSPSNRTRVPPGAVFLSQQARVVATYTLLLVHGDLQVLACRTSLLDHALTLTSFCSRLKTHLFNKAYGHTLVTA